MLPITKEPEISSRDGRIALIGLDRNALQIELAKIGEAPYRSKQIWHWLYHRGVQKFDDMTTLPKYLRTLLNDHCTIDRPKIKRMQNSSDGSKKWLVEFPDGNEVECVHIPEEDRGALCISSQVGCTLTCKFCHTGTQRLVRNLSSREIIEQFLIARDTIGEWPSSFDQRLISNVVMMGMGEPLHNFEPVVKAMGLMLDSNAYGLSKRRVTLSTSGLVPQIKELSKHSDVSLTISLHAPNDELRNELVPVNKKYPIKELLQSVRFYVDKCNDSRVTTFEYILIDRVNDSLKLAKELADLLLDFPCKINLIPFNSFSESSYKRPSNNRVKRFQEFLQSKGYVVTIRSTRGDDIMAACGQLVGKVNDKTRRKERNKKKELIQVKSI